MTEISILDPAHPDLITFHSMDSVAGSTSTDETGNFNATIYGATQVAGLTGNAMSFDGSNDYMVLDLSSVGSVSALAIACYIYRYQDNEGNAIFESGITGSSNRLIVHFPWESGTLYWDFCNTSSGRLGTPFNSSWYGSWQPAVFQYTGSHLEIWIGGELIASREQAGLVLSLAEPFYIARYTWGNQYAKFILDSLRIFNRGLTPNEILQLVEEPWPYEIRGLVNVDGAPLSTQVRLYNAASGELLHTLNTDANGEYQKVLSTADPIYAMAIEPNGYRPLVHGPINPALRNPS